jgi:hypothetical protein
VAGLSLHADATASVAITAPNERGDFIRRTYRAGAKRAAARADWQESRRGVDARQVT